MGYLLDTNVFIEAHHAFYRFSVCPGYWDWIAKAHGDGIVFSLDRVRAELLAGKDEVAAWADSREDGFFLPVDVATGQAASAVSAWAASRSFTQAALSQFLASTDFWLIAYALAHGLTVVTRERSEPDRKNKVKIPDACLGLGVAWMSPFDLLAREGAVFVLKSDN
jgi:predicted nucleic acid-binding protein